MSIRTVRIRLHAKLKIAAGIAWAAVTATMSATTKARFSCVRMHFRQPLLYFGDGGDEADLQNSARPRESGDPEARRIALNVALDPHRKSALADLRTK
jgi:hypothetical protein